jgi:NTE family protein
MTTSASGSRGNDSKETPCSCSPEAGTLAQSRCLLKALLEADITPDAIVGTSIGALNGAFLAGNPGRRGVEELAELWKTVHRGEIFPVRVRDLARGVMGHQRHLFDSSGLRGALLRAHLGFVNLEEAPTPMSVVATDPHNGKAVVLPSGNAIKALLASAAIPGVYPPVEIDGRTLVDGSVVANAPVAQAELYGPRRIVVLPTVPNVIEEAPGKAVAMMQRAMQLAGRSAERRLLAEVSSRQAVEWLPVPAEARHLSIFDFSATQRLIDDSYRLTSACLDERNQGTQRPAAPAIPVTPEVLSLARPFFQGAVA